MKDTKVSPKTRRKSRRLRINIGTISGGRQFEPDERTWAEYEAALGHEIRSSIRPKIIEIVQYYFEWQPFESAAPFRDDVLEYNEKARKQTIALRQTLRDQGQTEKTTRAMIGRNCKIRGVRPGLAQLDSIEHMLSSLITATTKTSKDLASSEGFAEGDQWNLMIPQLRALFRSSGLPHAASQDSTKTKTARGSAFVLFIKALQQSFPDPALRKHHGVSDFTLAKEINRASKKSGH